MTRKMKNSGIEWIGKIPMGWDIGRIDGFYNLRNTKVSDKDYPPLSVTMGGVVPQLETAAKTNAHDDRKLVRKGDFAINSRSDRRGSCGISRYDGSVSLINTILSPKGEMNPSYYDWLFHTLQFADEFYKWGHGIVDDLWTTNYQDMKKINIPVPPISEQYHIAAFLNSWCAEIDALTADIQSEIEMVEAYKRSVITEAVTKGLDKNAVMKDSGVEWIGEIPREWKLNRIKYMFKCGKGLSITKENLIEEGLPVLSYGQIHSKENNGTDIKDNLLRYVDFSYQVYYPQCAVHQFDFIFADTSEDYDGIGNCVYKRDNTLLFAGYHSIILKSKCNTDNRYLSYLFKTDTWRKQLRECASGVKVFSVSQRKILDASIIIPPINERKKIADYLDAKCAEIDAIIAQKQEQLSILSDYKKSLIYEYVTGKKEVTVP